MVRNNILAIALIIFSATTVAFSIDYTKKAGFITGLIPIPVNPNNDVVEYKCTTSKNKIDLNKRLKKIGWQNYETYTKNIDFNKNVALLIAKKSFPENHIIKLKKLLTDNNKLIAYYELRANASSTNASRRVELIGLTYFKYRPGIIVLIPKQVYDKGKLKCQEIKPSARMFRNNGRFRGASIGQEIGPN